KGLPPDQDDKDEPQVKDVPLPRSQPTKKLERLPDDLSEALGKYNSCICRSSRRKIVYQPGNETGDGHLHEGLLTNPSTSIRVVIYRETTPTSEEVS
ncbi:hypothetical protein B0J15DRAFT_409186, partial [Fusarium solani]